MLTGLGRRWTLGAAFGRWHVGDIEGRLPTDQGFDEWYGIKNTSDESAYSTYPCSPNPAFRAQDLGGPERLTGHPVADFNRGEPT